MIVSHDAVYEGLKKLPRPGCWNQRRDRVDFCCPVCNLYSHLGRHSIDAEGRVMPSVICPHNRPDGTPCTFHETIRLHGWHERLQRIPF